MKNKSISNKTRYILIMIMGVLMNEVFYFLADKFKLPVWLDMTGTAFAALVLEPTAGLMVGLVNNFYLAIKMGSSTLIYYAVSAAAALVVGLCMRKNGKVTAKRILPTALLVIAVTAVLSSILTLWQGRGVPTEKWEIYYYEWALSKGMHKYLACGIGVGLIKVYDTIVSGILIAAFYFVLPRSLKEDYTKQK